MREWIIAYLAFWQAPTVTEDLVPDEVKFQVFQVSIKHCLQWYQDWCEPRGCRDRV